jgi:aconitate hydratase
MGVLPLQFMPGESASTLGLTGEEVYAIDGTAAPLAAGERPERATVTADGRSFEVRVRIDTPMEVEYFRHGGILQYVLRQLRAA